MDFSSINDAINNAKDKINESGIPDKVADAINTAKDKINESGIPDKVAGAINTAKEKINASGVPDKVKSATANGLDRVAEVAENLATRLRHDDNPDESVN